MRSFEAQVSDIVKRSKRKLTAVMRQSVADVIEDAQTPRRRGGRMRVQFGFLRASGQASLTGLPTGPTRNDDEREVDYDEVNTVATIGTFDVGNTFFFGWTAVYAAPREVHDGFLEGAIMNWSDIVARNVEKVQSL